MTHEELKARALQDEAARAEYEALGPAFDLLHTLIEARQSANLTQAEVAERMGTKASAVARLEGSLASGKHSPSIATLRRYAEATGRRLEIRFVQRKALRQLSHSIGGIENGNTAEGVQDEEVFVAAHNVTGVAVHGQFEEFVVFGVATVDDGDRRLD